MSPALRYERVTFHYPDSERSAITDVDLDIAEGSFALSAGPTGAGKSTLLRAANGLVPHFTGGTFAGRVTVAGRDTTTHRPRDLADAVAFVPQDPGASFVLDRVEEELAYGMENLQVPSGRMRRRVEETLDLLDIAPLRDRSVRTLSGGERQRVAIAAALAAGPRLLVLDEPTSQLDPQGAEDVLAALQRMVHDLGMTVLLAEHRLERVAGFADIAVAVHDGAVTSGAPSDLLGRVVGGPPVTRLGDLLGWDPAPITVREARALARGLALGVGPSPPTVTPGAPLVRARGLHAGYSGAGVLHGVDLELGEGEIVALMGRNGAGKTTLLRCLTGVHAPARGSVEVPSRPPRPGIDVALCPQEPETVLFAETVEDEIHASLRARGRSGEPAPHLQRLALEGLSGRHPRDLSSGQRLLVAAAAVAASGAPALLLDEPTRGLDPEAKQRLSTFIRAHPREGGTVLFATHDVELVAALATRVVLLAGGEVIADGSPSEVLGDSHVFAPQMTRVFGPGWLTPEQVAEATGARGQPTEVVR
ncbi:MAG: ATP-binding cassette domain-containing protein [Actinomycetota bacterium]